MQLDLPSPGSDGRGVQTSAAAAFRHNRSARNGRHRYHWSLDVLLAAELGKSRQVQASGLTTRNPVRQAIGS